VGVVVGICIPLPLDHFFFCFLPPVAAGAMFAIGVGVVRLLRSAEADDGKSDRCGLLASGEGWTR
jgi:hypothetical protein